MRSESATVNGRSFLRPRAVFLFRHTSRLGGTRPGTQFSLRKAKGQKMVGKFGFLCVGAVVLGSTFAMPSSSELEKVKAEVDAIVKDVDAREKGDWCKAGDAILSLGGEATKDAECFLLRREAALRYLKSSNAEKAKDALAWFVDNGDSESVLAIDEHIRRQLTFKERKSLKTAPSFAEYEAFVSSIAKEHREKIGAAKRLSNLESKYAKDKENVRNRNLLAREYVLLGDWAKAIPLLSKSKGNIGLAAKGELAKPDAKGNDAVAIADGWWNVEGREYAKELTDACRRHAVEWYRTALTDESLANLVRMRIGGRIEEVESKLGVQNLTLNEKSDVSSGFPSVTVKGGETIRIPLDAKGKVFMELAACPPGEFTMDPGHRAPNEHEHKVKLTYPYLIGNGHVTFGMVKAVDYKVWKNRMDRIRTSDEKFYSDGTSFYGMPNGDLAIFLKKMNAIAEKCRDLRAYKGYEFRLPTEAEWVHAYYAGTGEGMEEINGDELKAYKDKLGYGDLPCNILCLSEKEIFAALKKKPNAWGIFNMANIHDDLSDTIELPLLKNGKYARWMSQADNDVFGYEDLEENPIRVCTAKNASRLSRRGPFGMRFKIARPIANEGGASLRLVYGPKLDKLNVYPKKGDEKRK